ncbi:hypothetical protein BDV41DRAFT_544147, partial [Aspergillus transmontanensis]
MVCSLLMHYFPEENGWEIVMNIESEKVVIYTVKCHDGNGLIDHLMALILLDDDNLNNSIKKFKDIYHSRFDITPTNKASPALMWGAIFQGSKALFYSCEEGGKIRTQYAPNVKDGQNFILKHREVIHFFLLRAMSHERINGRKVSWKGLERHKTSNRSHGVVSSRS